jgi:hypothetical protein
MKVVFGRILAVFGVLGLVSVLFMLLLQVRTTHQQNVQLQRQLDDLNRRIRQQETVNRRILSETEMLGADSYIVERELRKDRSIAEGETLVPEDRRR